MPADDTSLFHVGQVPVETILPLRHRMLRQGMPFESAHFPGDDALGVMHFAVRRRGEVVDQKELEGDAVCCLTLMAAEWDGRDAWQLRGMATATEYHGHGLGRRLFAHALEEARRHQPDWMIWCNARVAAIGFYERVGWEVVSEEFEIPYAGPHKKMVFLGVIPEAGAR